MASKKELEQRVEELESKVKSLEGRTRPTGGGSSRATPVESGQGYRCSRCGAQAYYDGRCGDGAILTCGCNESPRGSGYDPWDDFAPR